VLCNTAHRKNRKGAHAVRSVKKAVLYGFLVWLIVFTVSFLTFPLRDSNRPLFESIMPVALSICTVFFSILYFRHASIAVFKEGVLLGLTWLAINLCIDAPLFLFGGPMKTTISGYVSDIGTTYMVIIW
jgi:hypothetical protein